MKTKIVKKPYWQNKQTKQIVSFFGSVPFYNSTEQTNWEKKYKEIPKDQNDKLKQIRFLQSRGFDLSLIHKMMSGKEID